MTQEEKLRLIIKTLDTKKAEGIQAIKISDLTIIADYFIIASGNSSTQTRTLAEEVEYQMSQAGVEPERKEGYNGSNWVILDYGDIVVHVFYKEARDYYQLERLWADGERIDIEQFVTGE
ncbi:MAG: ribosome silencing factor [Porcipelethomonas sp.]